MYWERNIAVRMAQLGLTHRQVAASIGVTVQNWYGMRNAKNPTLKTMNVVGLAMACPVHILFGDDAVEVAGQPIPDWDWLAWLNSKMESQELKSGDYSSCWNQFQSMTGASG